MKERFSVLLYENVLWRGGGWWWRTVLPFELGIEKKSGDAFVLNSWTCFPKLILPVSFSVLNCLSGLDELECPGRLYLCRQNQRRIVCPPRKRYNGMHRQRDETVEWERSGGQKRIGIFMRNEFAGREKIQLLHTRRKCVCLSICSMCPRAY